MRVAVAQLNFKIGAFTANLEKIAAAVERARGRGAELVVFSELATVGYPPGDLLERDEFIAQNLEQLERVAALSDERLAVLIGFVDRNTSDHGKGLYNAAALCSGGRVIDRSYKCLLPTYDVFDEARYFEPAGKIRPLTLDGVQLGVTICEDLWSDADLWERRLYRRDPVDELVQQGAELLINISASPFTLGKVRVRREMVAGEARQHGRFFFYVNQVGGNDELVFDGHSLVAGPDGRVVLRADDFEEDLLVYDVPLAEEYPAVTGELRTVAESDEEEAYQALVLGTRDYVRKCGFSQVLLGLSGGIDSALTAVVAAAALGPENVLGVAMPTRYSSDSSLSDAESLARNLGIEYRVIAIDAVFQSFLDGLEPAFAGHEPDVTEENIQARTRGTVLMALANKLGRLLLATGNKSEVAVGYCTLYGDMCGGLAVISDVPKTLVYRLAELVNRERQLIPASTIDKAPSAELRPDQVDQDSLPPYEVLDAVLESYVEHCRTVEEMVASGLERAAVEQVVRLIDANEYKRRQAAPGIKISTKAFGIGRRYPIVADYRSLHERGGGDVPTARQT
jgi:NAD+ synthetase